MPSSVPHCVVPSAAAAAAVVVVVVVAVAAWTVDTAYPARCLMRTGIVVVASARWVVRAMSQVSAVAVVAAAAVQANAWSLALKWLSILSTSVIQYGRGVMPHTGCLPFGRWWHCRLLTTQSIVVPLPSTCE
jgi:hypothetical protein